MTTASRVLHIVGGFVALDDGTLAPLDVEIDGDRITRVAPRGSIGGEPGATVVDAADRILAPGFVDLQINGGWGHDFTDEPGSIGAVAAHLPATGVTSFVPTIVTSDAATRAAALDAWAGAWPTPGAAAAVGVHFEGPMLSPAHAGAHAVELLREPRDVDIDRWQRDSGVRIVTLAPELPGAIDVIRRLAGRGVTVAIGHTACSAVTFAAAREAGGALVTHLFNAMAPFDHRAPGPVGATLADDAAVAGLICDGIHVDPVAVRAAWRSLGPDRLALVTDATAALGAPHGTHRVGRLEVTAGPNGVRSADGRLAGSDLSLDRAVRNLVEFTGCTAGEAIRCATATPADVIGLTDRGRIRTGARADLVVLDPALRVERTIVAGEIAWQR